MKVRESGADNRDDGEYNGIDGHIQIDYEIDIVGGERGRLLATEQATSILEVLEWFSRQTNQPER